MRTASLLLCLVLLPSLASAAEVPKGTYQLITKGTNGAPGTDHSISPTISPNGKALAVSTLSSNFGAGTYNGFRQVMSFKTDGTPIESISRMAGGQLANLDCWASLLSKSGRYVAFECDSSLGLVGPPGGSKRVFWRDTKTGQLIHVSIGPSGNVANQACFLEAISDNGRYVLFYTSANNMIAGNSIPYIRGYLHDVETGITELVTVDQQGQPFDGVIFGVAMSGDARQIFFSAIAPSLGFGSDFQVYAHDRKLGTTTLLSKNASGLPGASSTYLMGCSRNGRYVLMTSYSLNLGFSLEPGNLVLLDRKTNELKPLNIDMPGLSDDIYVYRGAISNDGRRLVASAEYKSSATNINIPSLCEFDLKSGKRWTILSNPGSDMNLTHISFRASAKGDWIFFATSVDLHESNGKTDAYLYRAH